MSEKTAALAVRLIELCAAQNIMVATAESCTGGLISAALTDVAGSSAVVDRGFVTYSNEAKADMLSVPMQDIEREGAVSALVAEKMVAGALTNSRAQLAVAVTGIAGPGGGSKEKPVGLVYVAAQKEGEEVTIVECRFADEGHNTREKVRLATVQKALEMMIAEVSP